MDIHSLDRFIEAQERMYAVALEEIKSGLKRSHWMWYIFPQLRGLGTSSMAHVYGIAGLDEARAYLSVHSRLMIRTFAEYRLPSYTSIFFSVISFISSSRYGSGIPVSRPIC